MFKDARTPILMGGDQVFFWMDGLRLLHGEHVYRDFFQNKPPGTDLVYLGAFELLGPRIWVPNLVILVLGIAVSWLCYRISRLIMFRSRAALAAALCIAIPYGRLLNATHHWFSVLAVLGALAVLMKQRSPARIAVAGALLGAAAFFTQTRGPIAAVAIASYLTWMRFRTGERWSSWLKSQTLLFAPFLATWAALSSYYLATVGLRQLWFFQITMLYNEVGEHAKLFSAVTSADDLAYRIALFLLPLVYLASLWKCRKDSREVLPVHAERIALLAMVGAALFVEVTQSPNWLRLYCVAAPGVILFVWMAGNSGKLRQYAMSPLWFVAIAAPLYQVISLHRHASVITETPAGRVAADPMAAEKLGWLTAHTKPAQFFLQAQWPGIYLPLDVRNPLFLEDVEEISGATRLGYVESSIQQVESKRVRYVMWSPRLVWHSRGEFREFLKNHYRIVHTFADRDEIWERQ
jgi:hypothetical protein